MVSYLKVCTYVKVCFIWLHNQRQHLSICQRIIMNEVTQLAAITHSTLGICSLSNTTHKEQMPEKFGWTNSTGWEGIRTKQDGSCREITIHSSSTHNASERMVHYVHSSPTHTACELMDNYVHSSSTHNACERMVHYVHSSPTHTACKLMVHF